LSTGAFFSGADEQPAMASVTTIQHNRLWKFICCINLKF